MKEKMCISVIMALVMSMTFAGLTVYVPTASAQEEEITMRCFSTSVLLPDTQTREHVVIAGEQWIAQITYSNPPNGYLVNFTVNVTVPAGATYTANTDNGTLVPGAGPNGEDIVVCTLGTIKWADNESFEVAFMVDPDYVANTPTGERPICCNATVTYEQYRVKNIINLSDCDLVKARSDLKVTKMVKPDDETPAGKPYNYTIFVENHGPSTATNVMVTDTIVSDGSFMILDVVTPISYNEPPWANPGWISNYYELSVDRDFPMNPGERDEITIQMIADDTQDINNIVNVSCDNYDPDMSNNQAREGISILDTSDLEFIIRTDLDFVVAGNMLRYSIRNITNKGPSVATNVVAKCNLPAEVEMVAVTVSDGDCKAGTPGDPNDPTMCIIDELEVGETATMTIFVRVKPDVPINPLLPMDQPAPYGRGRIFCDAWVYSDNLDPDMGDNLDTWSTEVIFEADLQVFKSDVPDTVIAGELLTYEVIVNNAGPSVAQDVLLIDSLPDEVEFISLVVIDDPEFKEEAFIVTSQNEVICELGDISVGAPPLSQKNIFITVRVKPDTPTGTIITNNAEAYSAMVTFDPDTTNNILSAGCTECIETTSVVTEADLEIVKTSLPVKASAGDQIKYTIEVINHGPSDAQEVRVTDVLPKGVQFEVETLCNCTFFEECPGVLNCSIGTLKAGEMREFEIWVKVLGYGRCCRCDVPVGTVMVNEVRVMSTTPDPLLDNNGATAKTLKIKRSSDEDDGGSGQWYLFGQILLVGGLISTAAVITYRKKRNYHP